MNESARLNERLPPTTLLTSTKPANLQNADKESSAQEGWLDDDKFGAEDNGPCEGYMFFSVDLKPVLPVALDVSTVIAGLCMLLVQIPMLSLFTTLLQAWLSAPFAVVYGIVLGFPGVLCLCADPGQVPFDAKYEKKGAVKHEAMEGAEHRVSKVVRLNGLVRSGCLLLHEPKPLSQIRAKRSVNSY